MALQGWEQEKHRVQKENNRLKQLMISMADPLPHPSEDERKRPNPNTPPSSPYERGKSPHTIQAGLKINPNVAHTPHTPDTTYDDYGRPEKVPRYRGGNPSGGLIEIPWMKEEYQKIHPELEKLHNEKYHQANIKDSLQRENVGGTLRDLMLPLLIKEYGKEGGKYKNPGALISGMKKLV